MASLANEVSEVFEPEDEWVQCFGGGAGKQAAPDPQLLGGKGANLIGMDNIGLPVPPGFTLTTQLCACFQSQGERVLDGIKHEIARGIAHIENVVHKGFGDTVNPLLVSVRSGAPISMPGMMDTVLNLGLNDLTVSSLAQASNNERFAWDSYRRFIQMYAVVVLGLDRRDFDQELESVKHAAKVKQDADLSAADCQALTAIYKRIVERLAGHPFPQDVHEQLRGATAAVFRSWNCERAKVYRRLNGISDASGTAVTVQAMVFGNMGPTSATGVAFTRDPSTGERAIYGEYLINAQGEDVVAGTRTPHHLTRRSQQVAGIASLSLQDAMPHAFAELQQVLATLEQHFEDMQDVEFTIERGKLWLLQTRSGKRSGTAAIRIAVDMAREGLITRQEAVMRVDPLALEQLLHPTIDPTASRQVIAHGLAASPGAACGRVIFDPADAVSAAAEGEKVILVRTETSPEDIHGMHAAQGVLTTRGGMTSHAAVVARGMGRPCVSGAGTIYVDELRQIMRVGALEVRKGDMITLDGTSGEVMLGELPTIPAEFAEDFLVLIGWADGFRRMHVRTNAETAADCRTAVKFGAEGIGLCRTEHMFFDKARITAVREMILAEDEPARRRALNRLLPEQRQDFSEIFSIMGSLPVTIRLLDPPLHEFLPHKDEEFAEVARATGVDVDRLRRRASDLSEANPMLGHRGCRLGITYPEIYEMQTRAILEAACAVLAETGTAPTVEIMVPLIVSADELRIIRELIDRTADAIFSEQASRVEYLVGTMIELPRAALCAGAIAEHAQFFSFGTNDLTQTALGISRDDAERFLKTYVNDGLLPHDPFVTIDEHGVGELVALAAKRGRAVKRNLKLGICGEHGGDPQSIALFERLGLDYVSASPYRVPIARLAAAQEAIRCRHPLALH